MNATSPKTTILAPAAKVYALVANCNHFGKYIPPQINNFSSTEDQCQFTINNMITLQLIIVEKQPYSFVKFDAQNDMKKEMNMEVRIEEIDAQSANLELVLNADVPMFLRPMVKGHLQTFVDKLAEKIKEEAEK